MNLNDFSGKNPEHLTNTAKEKLKQAQKIVNDLQKENNKTYEGYEEAYEKYSDMSEENLMKELFEQTKKQKQAGTLNNESIDNVYNNLSPLLSEEQKKNLENLIKAIK